MVISFGLWLGMLLSDWSGKEVVLNNVREKTYNPKTDFIMELHVGIASSTAWGENGRLDLLSM